MESRKLGGERDPAHRLPRVPYRHLLVCPRCQKHLATRDQALKCFSCGDSFPVRKGIPEFFSSNDPQVFPQDVTERIRSFYEETPFPDYEDTECIGDLIRKARQSVFAKLLDQQIPFGVRILECGCGTGQLSNFLGMAHRTVFGTDVSLNSLQLAECFRRRSGLDRVFFLQMDLFRPVFLPNTFQIVICNGVLHHTFNPGLGLKVLASLVKPGGYLIVGLYHRFGRLGTDLRRMVFRVTGDRGALLDPRLRKAGLGATQRAAWLADQYRNPHEVKHTISKVLTWLEPNNLELVKTIPKTRYSSPFLDSENLFEPEPPGLPFERWLIEFSQALIGDREGGFFTVICRKRAGDSQD